MLEKVFGHLVHLWWTCCTKNQSSFSECSSLYCSHKLSLLAALSHPDQNLMCQQDDILCNTSRVKDCINCKNLVFLFVLLTMNKTLQFFDVLVMQPNRCILLCDKTKRDRIDQCQTCWCCDVCHSPQCQLTNISSEIWCFYLSLFPSLAVQTADCFWNRMSNSGVAEMCDNPSNADLLQVFFMK